MATYTAINDFAEDLALGVHDFTTQSSTYQLKIALSNTAPSAEASNPTADGNGVLANVTEISYTNYTDDLTVDRTLESETDVLSNGTFTLDCGDFVITASGGALADFRYIYLYNDTPTSPADPLIAVWDHGSTISLADGDSANININASGLIEWGPA